MANMFQTNFYMMEEHGYSLSELESMVPWERDVYVALTAQHVQQKNEEMQSSIADMRRK